MSEVSLLPTGNNGCRSRNHGANMADNIGRLCKIPTTTTGTTA